MRSRVLGWWVLGTVTLLGCSNGSMVGQQAPPPAVVQPGIEVLLADSLALVRGRRVGLLTNQTGIDRAGRSDVELLLGAGVDLRALFSPEHGFRGAADPGASVGSTRDSATGLPIYSLYGRTVAPTPEMLADLDVLLIDLQDVGARYYTYISTAIEVLRAAAPRRLTVVILDRPNPLGGVTQGNVLDRAFQTFVGRLAVPMRHGLTMGELARLAADDLHLGADLRVVPMRNWRRSFAFPATGLPWVPPSPNLRDQESLWHYPGLCLFEGTNLSVGRGTDAPFTRIGAPWLDAEGIRSVLAGRLTGVTLSVESVTPHAPGDGKFPDVPLRALRLTVTDPARYDATVTAIRLLAAIRARHPAEFRFLAPHFDRLAGTDQVRRALEAGASADSVTATWDAALDDFRRRSAPYLRYPQ